MNLLLVDDEPIALRKLERVVSEVIPEGTCHCFTWAKEAMAYAEQEKVDIAFLDIQMNKLDGITMAKQLQQKYPRINIIFCTGYMEYALEAHNIYCSGYLMKPFTAEQIRMVMKHLRYPVGEETANVRFRCFGEFEAYYKGEAIQFQCKKSKELLAYLVDRNGADCTTGEIMAVLFGDEQRMPYLQKLRRDLITTFEELGEPEVLRLSRGRIGVNRNRVSCDYFDYLDGKIARENGEYMEQYHFGEETRGDETWTNGSLI